MICQTSTKINLRSLIDRRQYIAKLFRDTGIFRLLFVVLSRSLIIRFLCALAILLNWQLVSAGEDLIEDIELRNLERLDPDLVFDSITLDIGDAFDQSSVSLSVRKLFATSYFDDIRVEREGNTLIFVLEERPTIRKVIIDEEVADREKMIRTTLNDQLISEGEILRRNTLSKIITSLEFAYSQNGKAGTDVQAVTEAAGHKLVDIHITINEAPVASIAKINIIGNYAFEDERILAEFESTARTTWNAFWSAGRGGGVAGYVKQRLDGDLGRLRDLYLEHGYINFAVESTQVSLSRDRKNFYISIAVHEGEQFTIDKIEFWGDLLVAEGRYRNLLDIVSQDIYVNSLVTASKMKMEQMLGDLGYGFAQVNINLDKNQASKTVSVGFFVNPGNRTYVRRITFKGNTKTADDVLRRELRQFEGGWYSSSKIRTSLGRLRRLGYFSSVSHRSIPVPNKPDQLDLEFTVKESPTANLAGGLIYSDQGGIGVNVSYRDNNVLGTGNSMTLGVDVTGRRQRFSISWGRPYITSDGVSLDSELFYSRTDYQDTKIANYATSSYGGTFGLGYPISNTLFVSYGYSYARKDISLGTDPVIEVKDFIDRYSDTVDTYGYYLSVARNTLNKGIFPTSGSYNKGLLRAYMASDTSPGFYTLSYDGKYFFPLDGQGRWASRTSVRLGYGQTYDGHDQFPFLFNFYSGGYGTVRGYNFGSMGPRATSSTENTREGAIGGNIMLQGTQELIFPLWFSSNSVRTSLFYDIGNVFTSKCVRDDVSWCSEGVATSELRSSYGVTLIWYTVVGPFIFILPRAIDPQEDDSTTSFEFRIGRVF